MDLKVIENIIQLLDEGNTIPFIARYRKELTKGATDEQLRDFHEIYTYTKNLEARKDDVIRLINEKGLLTDELKKEIEEAETLARVEDLYRPFKEKKNTKATIAKAKGLEPLAKILQKADLTQEEFEKKAEEFVHDDEDPKKSVKTIEEAIQGAEDIIAEEVSDHANLREEIKKFESLASIAIPENFDFSNLSGLTNEVKQKLAKQRPANLAEASSIPGITPAAISILIMHHVA